jgi:ribose transport system ATP-binding protein
MTQGVSGGRPDEVALSIRHLSKTFAGGKALNDVSFDVRQGTVHALLGGNGSGKSTLVKSIAGVQAADPGGELVVGGTTVSSSQLSPHWARTHGLRFVHQNPGIFPTMTVAENLALGHGLPTQLGRLRRSEMNARARRLLAQFEIDVEPTATMGELRVADQTMVAIARALQLDDPSDRIVALVLDEPTAALPEEEVEILLAAIKRAARSGVAIIYISHRLEEVLAIADALTVLRDGQEIITRSAAGLTEQDLVSYIVGRPLDEVFPVPAHRPDRAVVAEMIGVSAGPLRNVSLRVHAGEILGIAGLLGSGRTELLRTFFGVEHVTGGQLLLQGTPVTLSSPAAAMDHGVAYIPEDRDKDASFLDLTVRENISAAVVRRFSRYGRLRRPMERRSAQDYIGDFRIRTKGDEALMSSLSGGNRQKVILARWMQRAPQLILLDEPTQGVDVGARADAYHIIREAVSLGAAAILVSSDFEELADMSDRVVVLNAGRITAEIPRHEVSRHCLTEKVFLARKDVA